MTLFHNDEFESGNSIKKEEESGELIGYCEREEGFYPVYAALRGSIVTQAFICCKYCSRAVSTNSGPRYDVLCLSCFDKEPEERGRT